MEINALRNVFTIKAGSSNVYLIKNGNESILVDAGNKNKGKKILRIMRNHGINPEDIALIVITHCHYDHVGSLHYLKEKTGACVLVHHQEAENLKNGFLDLPDGTNLLSMFLVWLGRSLQSFMGKFHPVQPDIAIEQRYDPDINGINCYVIPTPGHTEGSLSLIFEDEAAFVGDAAFNIFRKVYPPFANNRQKLLESWEFLLNTKVKYIFPGHGRRFKIDRIDRELKKRK